MPTEGIQRKRKRERETYCIQHVSVVKGFKQKDYEHETLLCIRLEVFELFIN